MKLRNKVYFGLTWIFSGLLIACSATVQLNTPQVLPSPVIKLSVDTSSVPVDSPWARHAILVINWPERTVQVIPVDTENILFQALKLDGSVIASASVSRPPNATTSSVRLPESKDAYLPIGPVVLFVQAKNSLSRVLAQASESVVVITNQVVNATIELVTVDAVKVEIAVPSRTTIFVAGPDANSQVNPTTVQLNAITTMSDATTNTLNTWSTSNSGIASVNANGLVSAVSAGTATITATSVDGKKSTAISVKVEAAGEVSVIAK